MVGRLLALRASLAGLVALFQALPALAQRAPFPLVPGELAATCAPLSGQSGFVVGLIDIRDPGCAPGAALGQNWLAPMYHNELPNPTSNPADEWTFDNLGYVFGITIDDAAPPSIYVTATSVWGLTDGRVFRLRGSDGRIELFATLPNTGPALGNIAYDRVHRQFLVTNMEDGRIYRLGFGGNTIDTFDPFLPDDGTPGFAPLGERLWAVGVHGFRVYFSVWAEDQTRSSATAANTIWSVGLDPASGAFVPSDLTFEVAMPPYGSGEWSSPVADIAFADDDWMVAAERVMAGDTQTGAHSALVIEFSGGHLGWVDSSNRFVIGVGVNGTNSAGGVDFDCPIVDGCNTGRRLWAMGDAIILQAANNVYGVMGIPETGGGVPESYLVDLDGDLSTTNPKTRLGCLEINRPVCSLTVDAGRPVELCGTPGPVTLDASGTLVSGCSGAVEYRWLSGATILRDWATAPTHTVTPTATTTYRVEARCGRCPCFGADSVTVTVWPDAAPGSLGNTLLGVRQAGDVVFSWAASATARSYVLYRGTVKSAWPPVPLRSGLGAPGDRLPDVPGPPLLYFYRVAGVSCAGREGP